MENLKYNFKTKKHKHTFGLQNKVTLTFSEYKYWPVDWLDFPNLTGQSVNDVQ